MYIYKILKTLSIICILLLPTKVFSFDYTKTVEKERIGEFKLLDSLLKHLDKEYIEEQIKYTRHLYLRFTDEYGEVYMLSKDSTFKQYSFFVKKDDPDFLIHSIRAMKGLPYNLCTKLHPEVVEMLDERFPTDDQYTEYVDFIYTKEPNLANIRDYKNTEMYVKCFDYINPEFLDNLSITIKTKEQAFWMREDLAN